MQQITVFSIRFQEVERKLVEIGAQYVTTLDTVIHQYEMSPQAVFVPPIYHSPKFFELFNLITQVSQQHKTLKSKGISLFIIQHQRKNELVLQDENNSKSIYRIPLEEKQYENMLRVLPAAGMQESATFRKNAVLYHYDTLQTIYTLYRWTRVPPFMMVQSLHEADLIEALALLGVSMNKTMEMSLKEIETYYRLPSIS